MKHSVQFAQREESPEYYSETQEAAEVARGSAQNPFRRRDPAEAVTPAPADAGTPSIEDLVGELEAALMADLHSVSSRIEPQSAPADESSPAAYDEDATVDAEALQRLMMSIRQPAPKPRQEEAAPERNVRPRSPMPEASTDAGEPMRRAGSRFPERREATGRRLQSSLIVGAALVALAGGGAFMTVQSVTAHDDPGPVPAGTTAAAAPVAERGAARDAGQPSEVEIAVPETAAAKAEDRAPAETVAAPSESATPIRLAGADPASPPGPQPADAAPREDIGQLTEAATRSTLDGPSAVGTAVEAAAPPAPPAPERLASADPATTAPEARPAPVRRSLGPIGAGPAKIASGVKLRSNPDNGAPVVGLLNAGTSVTVIGCKGWCEVVAGDKRGFVFQRFLAQGGAG